MAIVRMHDVVENSKTPIINGGECYDISLKAVSYHQLCRQQKPAGTATCRVSGQQGLLPGGCIGHTSLVLIGVQPHPTAQKIVGENIKKT